MLLFLLTVLNCPIINVTHCKKIHNNYCVPACIFLTEETNKHCLQNLLWYLIKQTPLMWRSQAKRIKTLVLSFFLFLTIYILILRSSFSLISSRRFSLLTVLAQWSLTSSSSWTATKDRDEEGLGIGLELQGFTGDNAGSGRSSLFSPALDALGGAPTAQPFCSFSF